jgi:hypothetical protein
MNMIQIKTHNLESNAVEGPAIPPLPPPAFPQLKTSAAGCNCMPPLPLPPAGTFSNWCLANMAGLLYSTVERLPLGPTTSKGSVNEYRISDGDICFCCVTAMKKNRRHKTRLAARTTSASVSCGHSPRCHYHRARTLSLA